MSAIPKFVVLSEQLRGQTFELNQDEITIGRADGRSICLKDPTVSTLHCKVTRTDAGFTIADAGSTNGTKINGKPLEGEYALQSGDLVKIGAFDLLYDTDDKTMTMSIQKTQTGIDINAASATQTQTIKAVANAGFTERKQSNGLSNKLMIIIIVLLVLIFLAMIAKFFLGSNKKDDSALDKAPAVSQRQKNRPAKNAPADNENEEDEGEDDENDGNGTAGSDGQARENESGEGPEDTAE